MWWIAAALAEPPAHGPIAGVHLVEASSLDGRGRTSGLGASFGAPLAHGALEAELVADVLPGPHLAVPIDLLLEIPVHLGSHLDAFVAMGPGVELSAGLPPVPTGNAAIGGRGWWGVAGFGIELDYTWMLDRRQGLRIAAGPLIRL